ncbi:MAG: EAL domain-containing protein [Rhodocyclaceae bacterium]|nr:EAL domain-containing protein [Rhodocyclaceae bacterium]
MKGSPRTAATEPADPATDATDASARPAAELLHELQRRQTELEIENEDLRQAAAALRRSDAWARLILDTVPEAMLVVDEQGRVISANRRTNELFGYPAGAMSGLAVEALMPERFRAGHGGRRARFMAMPQSRAMGQGRELQGRRRDGSEFPCEIGLAVMPLEQHAFVVVSVVDISERKRAEEELRIAAIAFESQSGMMVTDPQGVILRVNRAFTRLTGYSAQEAVGQTPRLLSSGRHSPEFYGQMWATIAEKGHWQGQVWNRHKNGRIFAEWLTITAVAAAGGGVSHYVGTFSDITENAEAEAQIHRLAYYDALTQLPNRRLLQDRLSQALATSARNGLHGAILFLDLDNFKAVNDTRGHHTGDRLLVAMTQRLRLAVRECDTVARLGGDEFVVLLEELGTDADEAATLAKQVGEKLGAAISQSITIDRIEFHCTASIGIRMFYVHETVEDLLKHADLAMYQAKTAGRNTLRFFDPAMQARLDERSALESALRKALKHRQLQLFYQPQIDAAGCIIGAETLLRWLHPERGLIAPGDFIPLAEDCGLILPIGHWVLETACAQLKNWSAHKSTRGLVLAVNVSARQFRQADFAEQVKAVLDASGANPAHLKLELTESLVLDNVDDTIGKMQLLKALGISFSMDDFGTGYSSLAYLTRLPLDQLKIDRSFVLNLPDNVNDGIIARTIITMGRSLGLDVIAEGVETEGQREFLNHHGCHGYQGYLYSKPLPLDRFEEFLAARAM